MATQKKKRQRRERRRKTRSVPSEFFIVEADGGEGCALVLEDIEAADGEESKLHKFTMNAYNGGKLDLGTFMDPVVVDLSGLKIPAKSRPILLGHDPTKIVGHTESIQVNDGSIKIKGVISGGGEDAQNVVASSLNGFPWQASIGARSTKMSFVDDGETVKVNGRTFKGPLLVARQSTLRETSFVALGADDTTSAKIAASASSQIGVTEMDFESWVEAQGWKFDELSDSQRVTLQAAFDAKETSDDEEGEIEGTVSPVLAADGGDAAKKRLEATRKADAAEVDRVDGIKTICAKYKNPNMKINDAERLIQSVAVEDGWTVEKTELEAMRSARAAPPKTSDPRDDGSVTTREAIEAALCMSAGISEEVAAEGISEASMQLATSKQFAGYTLHALMDDVIDSTGTRYRGSRKTNGFIKAALAAERTIQASAGLSTISLSGILSNVANKQIIASYQSQGTAWPRICAVRNHSDFKVNTRYRLDSTGAFRKVGADGELKHVGLDDANYTNQLDTYGAIISLTRQQQINDDLGAFLQIPQVLGRMSALRIEEAVFVLLLSNPSSFYSIANNNLLTGAGSALDIAALTTAEQTFRDMVDPNGKPILVPPSILLVGSANAVTAKELFDETKVMSDTTATSRKFAANPHVGKFEPVSSPYLSNTAIKDQDGNSITGQDATQHYLFADPAVLASIGVAFLNGMQMPTIESDDAEFNILGMQWRAFHDFGIGMEDPNGSVKSAGA